MADPLTVTTYVVDHRLPWPEDGPAELLRGDFDIAAIIDGTIRRDCRIRKIAPLGATLGSPGGAPPAAGTEVAIELGTGQRRKAKVEWARGGEIGIAFQEPVDVIALINRTLVAQPVERRRMPRVELRAPVHVKWAEHLEPATLRNMSSTGMQIEGVRLPPTDTMASLFVEGLRLPACEVVWKQDKLIGVEFFEEVNWSSIIAWVREAGRAARAA
jgi:hypothetical protein